MADGHSYNKNIRHPKSVPFSSNDVFKSNADFVPVQEFSKASQTGKRVKTSRP